MLVCDPISQWKAFFNMALFPFVKGKHLDVHEERILCTKWECWFSLEMS